MAKTGRAGRAEERASAEPFILPPISNPSGGGGGGAGRSENLIQHDYGTLRMKAYPLDEFQLQDLARIGTAAAFCFSISGACMGFGTNLYKDLAIATGVSKEIIATWVAIRYVSFVVGSIFAAVGFYLFKTGHTRVEDIKRHTTFPGEELYQSRSWLPLVFRLAIAIGLLVAGGLIGKFIL